MYYTVELLNAEDFVERIENQYRHERAKTTSSEIYNNAFHAQVVDTAPKSDEMKKVDLL